jgi:hypothetical protein
MFIVPNYRARLDNLVKSASMYKTKACGVIRKSSGSRLSTTTPSRVIIEHEPSSLLNTQRASFNNRRTSNSSMMSTLTGRKSVDACARPSYQNQSRTSLLNMSNR